MADIDVLEGGAYRLYWLNVDGKIKDAEWLTARSHMDALKQILARQKQSRWELWRGDRRIGSSDNGEVRGAYSNGVHG